MTIACCLVLPEGVIFASDSTVSEGQEGSYHYLNHNQKIYEFGEDSTIGVMTWGLSSLRSTSHRTLVARTADEVSEVGREAAESGDRGKTVKAVGSLRAIAQELANNAWSEFQVQFKKEIEEYTEIYGRALESAKKQSARRSEEDDERLQYLQDELRFGYCIGGHFGKAREPEAYWFEISPTLKSPPTPNFVDGDLVKGQPEYFHRIYWGHGLNVTKNIMDSGFWMGSETELNDVLNREFIIPPELTIRDGIDFAHFIVYSTIKTLKFSDRDQVCGGPIEVGVVTTDRKFRWVKHKTFAAAIGE